MKKVNWVTLMFVVAFHFGFVFALTSPSFKLVMLSLCVWFVSLCPGIGAGFHRLLTHRGFKTSKAVEYALSVCGCLALQGSPIWWVATHRAHHKFSDHAGLDPHTPNDGGMWAHMGWLITKTRFQDPEIITIYAPDLLKYGFHRWLRKFFWLPITVLGLTLWWFWNWQALLWGICVPVVVSWHSTWLVNSATHMWGSRRFETRDNSRNNWWVAILTFGEGWHNNHHAYPVNCRHGHAWWEVDINWYFINLLKVLGLAKN